MKRREKEKTTVEEGRRERQQEEKAIEREKVRERRPGWFVTS